MEAVKHVEIGRHTKHAKTISDSQARTNTSMCQGDMTLGYDTPVQFSVIALQF
jgi:hypothetical protein